MEIWGGGIPPLSYNIPRLRNDVNYLTCVLHEMIEFVTVENVPLDM